MSQRDTGWVQLYCASAQEVLDSVLCAYRIAETVLLPVMVCAEGFLLSHTSEIVEVPEQETVDAFLPVVPSAGRAGCSIRGDPHAFSQLPQPQPVRRLPAQRRRGDGRGARRHRGDGVGVHLALRARRRSEPLEVAGDPGADTALVTVGTIGDTARELLGDDDASLLVRVHAYRPFPCGRAVVRFSRESGMSASSIARPPSGRSDRWAAT